MMVSTIDMLTRQCLACLPDGYPVHLSRHSAKDYGHGLAWQARGHTTITRGRTPVDALIELRDSLAAQRAFAEVHAAAEEIDELDSGYRQLAALNGYLQESTDDGVTRSDLARLESFVNHPANRRG